MIRAAVRKQRPSLAQVARLRGRVYALLSALLLDPDAGLMAGAAAEARALREVPWLAGLAFASGLAPALARTATAGCAPGDPLARCYTRLFVDPGLLPPIPLRESAYFPGDEAPGMSRPGPGVHYAAAGLRASGAREDQDHVAVELEFAAVLCSREAQAWQDRRLPDVCGALELEHTFLHEHLCRWLPALAGALAARDPDCLYSVVAAASRALAAHDVDFTAALAEGLREGRFGNGG